MRRWVLERSYLFGLLGQGTFGILAEPVAVPGARCLDRPFVVIERPWLHNQEDVSCIPEGRYRVTWHTFPTHGPRLWIHDVPGRTAVMFHPGNWMADSKGCPLPNLRFGFEANAPRGYDSVKAVELIEAAVAPDEEIELLITHYLPGAVPGHPVAEA